MASPNAHMALSPEGESYIKLAEEEGGKPKLKAYNDGTGTWTIGWGCTKGVKREPQDQPCYWSRDGGGDAYWRHKRDSA